MSEPVLILTRADVEALLPMDECIEVMAEALRQLALGESFQPLRMPLRHEKAQGLLGLMPGWCGGENPLWGLKEICVFPTNPARGLDTHLGAVLLHRGDTGELLAVVNAAALTAIRTAAVSAVATRLLARPQARRLAIIGTGVQARSHLAAAAAERSLEWVRIAGRTPERARSFVDRLEHKGAFAIEAADSVESAVREADIITTVTSSRTPVIDRTWLSAGAHLNLVGSSTPRSREVDGATMAAARIYVDRRESAMHESGDYLHAVEEGMIEASSIVAELGEVLLDPGRGRRSAEEITLFDSLGLAVEDLSAAAHVYAKAMRLERGIRIDFEA